MTIGDENATALPQLPYRGIQPFRYVDSPIFFAREEETRHLLQLVSVYRGVMLYGDSGVGKSSLINAGLLPAAARLGFQPERVRVQPRGDQEIVVERIPVADEGAPYLPSSFGSGDESSPLHVLSCDEFARRVREVSTSTRPLLVFDQFEELVTLFEEAGEQGSQHRTADMLGALLREELPVKLLFVFREDYLAKVKPLLAPAPELIDQVLRLRPPAAEALPTIIRGPFERHPGHFERELGPDVSERLRVALADRFGSGDVSLSEVQTVCLRLWRSDEPAALLEARGVQGLLEDYLGEELDRFPEDLRYAAGALLSQMVTAAGTRNVISAEDLIEHVQDEEQIPRELLERALDLLERKSKLVRRERRRDLYLYEITSEFLVPWISRRREELVRSQDWRRLRRRVLRAGAIVGSVALVLAVALVWALGERSKAERKAMEATASGEVVRAASMLAVDPAKALLIASDAARRLRTVPGEPREQAMSVLSQAALASHLRAVLRGDRRDKTPMLAAGFTAGGEQLVTVRASGEASVWDVDRARRVGVLPRKGGATRAEFSRDGALLAIQGEDSWSLWDTARQRRVGPLLAGRLVIGPNGRMLALGVSGKRRRVRLFSVEAGGLRERPALAFARRRRGLVASMSFSADSGRLLSVFGNGEWVVHDVRAGKQAPASAGGPLRSDPARTTVDASLSANGRVVAVATNEESGQRLQGFLRFYDSVTGKLLGTHWLGAPVTKAGSGRDGRLVLATEDGSVQVWQPRRGRAAAAVSLRGHTRPVTSASFSDDGVWLATASGDLTSRIWDARTGELRATLLGHPDGIRGLAFSPKNNFVVTTSEDGTARLWRTLSAGPNIVLPRHLDEVGRATFSGDGRFVLTASLDDSTFLVRAATGQTVRSFGKPRRLPIGLQRFIEDSVYGTTLRNTLWLALGQRAAVSRDGSRVITGNTANGLATLWDVRSGKPLAKTLGVYPEDGFFGLGPKQEWAALPTSSRGVSLYDTRTGRVLRQLAGNEYSRIQPFGVAASADGRYLVTAEYQGRWSVRVWDISSGRQAAAWTTPATSRIRYVATDSSGRYAAGGNWAGTVWIWRIGDGKRMARFHADPAALALRAIAFSPDGTALATATDGSEARLWDVRGRRLAILTGHKGAINDIEFSPDGTLVVTASDDGTVRVWGVRDGKTRAEFRQSRPGRALSASFDNPAGRRIVVGASDGSSDIYACPVCGGEDELFEFARKQAPLVP